MTDTRPVWLDEDWFDAIAEAFIRTNRPGLAEAFRDKWRAAPANAAEAAVRMLRTTEFDETDTWKDETIVAVVLRALGEPEAT